MKYCDTHTHLCDTAFDADRADIISQCLSAGISLFGEIACSPAEWAQCLELKKKYPENIVCALGVHPHECGIFNDETTALLEKTIKSETGIFAVGEIGLDYAKSVHSSALQKQVFAALADLALRLKIPMVLHCRNPLQTGGECAYKDLFEVLDGVGKSPLKRAGVLHCFSGEMKDAKNALDRGFFLGITGPVTYPKNNSLREIVKFAGVDNIILETDCPYLPPQTKRGQRNSPRNIPEICATVAGVLGIPEQICAEKTTQNFRSIIA